MAPPPLMLLVAMTITMQVSQALSSESRIRRYVINPLYHKWDHNNLTYRVLVFPQTLSQTQTREALSAAFTKWSDASALSFTEVRTGPSDITIGFLTRCFDGLNGELAHAFPPPRGDIHFDDHEFWVLGKSRFSWRQGVWLNDLVQVAAHEIGHALGLGHSQDPKSLMSPNATSTGQRSPSQDDLQGIHQLYGCVDKKRVCESWARLGFCEKRKIFMKKNCALRCDLCHEWEEAPPTAPPPNLRVKTVPRGKVVGFRCGTRNIRNHRRVRWYKDGELILGSVKGHIEVKGRDLRIVANEFNEGSYTCRHGNHGPASSWNIRVQDQDQG